jgi:hypothetical protein
MLRGYLAEFRRLFVVECRVPFTPECAPAEPIVELAVPFRLLWPPLSDELAEECRLPFVPVAAPFEPIFALAVPFADCADAALAKAIASAPENRIVRIFIIHPSIDKPQAGNDISAHTFPAFPIFPGLATRYSSDIHEAGLPTVSQVSP